MTFPRPLRRLFSRAVIRRTFAAALAAGGSVLLSTACHAATGFAGLLSQVQPGGTGRGAAPAEPVFQQSWYLEIAIVILLMGGALFAVCKSSRRT